MKNKNLLIRIVALLVTVAAIAAVVVFLPNNKLKTPKTTKLIEIELTTSEESTLSMINLIIAKAELRSPQTAHIMYLNQMGDIARRYNASANWFDDSKATFTAKADKSRNQQTITLSNGSYCAEFTLREDIPLEYTLTHYSFDRKDCPGKKVMFLTTEEIDRLPKSMKE